MYLREGENRFRKITTEGIDMSVAESHSEAFSNVNLHVIGQTTL